MKYSNQSAPEHRGLLGIAAYNAFSVNIKVDTHPLGVDVPHLVLR